MVTPPVGPLSAIQQGIVFLLLKDGPVFLSFGHNLFLSFATILLAWQGIQMMLRGGSLGGEMFDFAKLLLFISFGFAMIAFYEAPIPGFGVSFTNLITDQTAYFTAALEQGSIKAMNTHLDDLWAKFVEPDVWAILPNLVYWLLMIVVVAAKAALLVVNIYGMVASAVCALVGPIFVPFFIVPQLEWLFWGWLKAFIQYSFITVIGMAYVVIFERFVFFYVTTLPPTVTAETITVYGLQALVVVATLAAGIFTVPFLTSAIFSGHAHHGGGALTALVTRAALKK